jgi:hypothetical protein
MVQVCGVLFILPQQALPVDCASQEPSPPQACFFETRQRQKQFDFFVRIVNHYCVIGSISIFF